MKISTALSLACCQGLFIVHAGTALAADYALQNSNQKVNTKKWKCKYCQADKPVKGQIGLSWGYLNDPQYRFASELGHNRQQSVFKLSSNLYYADEDGDSYRFRADGDHPNLTFSTHQHNTWRLELGYRELRQFDRQYATWLSETPTADGLLVPLTEPQVFTPELKRQQTRLNLSFDLHSDWQPFMELFHEKKSGSKRTNVNILTQAATLRQPIDQSVSGALVGLRYAGEGSLFTLSYHGTRFNNDQNALSWQSPFVALATAGQQSTPPDNHRHKLTFKGAHRAGAFNLQSAFSYSSLFQNQAFLATALDSQLSQSLPQDSLSGRVNKLNWRFKANYRRDNNWQWRARFNYNKRNNATERLLITPVITDSYVGAPRWSSSYDFSQFKARFEADHRLNRQHKLRYSLSQEDRDRSGLQQTDTRQRQVAARWIFKDWRVWDSQLSVEHIKQDGNRVQYLQSAYSRQNPAMRQYHLADFQRHLVDWQLGYYGNSAWQARLNLSIDSTGYPQSDIGLRHRKSRRSALSINYDGGWWGKFALSGNYGWFDDQLAGSSTFSTANWWADNRQRQQFWQLRWQRPRSKEARWSFGATASINKSSYLTDYLSRYEQTTNPWSWGRQLKVQFTSDFQYSERDNLRIDVRLQRFDESLLSTTIPVTLSPQQFLVSSPLANDYDSYFLGVEWLRKL